MRTFGHERCSLLFVGVIFPAQSGFSCHCLFTTRFLCSSYSFVCTTCSELDSVHLSILPAFPFRAYPVEVRHCLLMKACLRDCVIICEHIRYPLHTNMHKHLLYLFTHCIRHKATHMQIHEINPKLTSNTPHRRAITWEQ